MPISLVASRSFDGKSVRARMKLHPRRLLFVVIDAVLLVVAYASAFWLRWDWEGFAKHREILLHTLPILLAISLYVHMKFGLFNAILKYASVETALAVAKAVVVSVLISAAVFFLTFRLEGLPRSILVVHAMAAVLLVGASRVAVRLARRGFNGSPPNAPRVALYGAGDVADMVLRSLKASPSHVAAALIDPDPSNHRGQIQGIPVVGGLEALPVLAREKGVRELWVCEPGLQGEEFRKIFHLATKASLSVKTVAEPEGGVSSNGTPRFKDPKVEDLLRRPPKKLDRARMRTWVEGRRVLVTGAGGSIGAEISRQVSGLGPSSLLLLDNGEYNLFRISRELGAARPFLLDVRDSRSISRLFEEERPEIVIHAAAYKHVPMVELNPLQGILVNVRGFVNVAEAARAAGAAEFLFISSDKAVRPSNVMGATKRLGEKLAQVLNREGPTRFTAVRFGNVLGSSGSVVPIFAEQIQRGGPVTVTHPEMTRYFMLIEEAVELVIQAGSIGRGGEILILDMGSPIRIQDLARDLIHLMGRSEGEVRIEFTGPRPGEKIHEELFLSGGDIRTEFPDLWIDHERPPVGGWAEWRAGAESLARAAQEGRHGDALSSLNELVSRLDEVHPGMQPELRRIGIP